MKVTAFHLANKVEEAVRSYFSNSFMFSSRTVDVERTVDFRKGNAALQFYLHDGDEIVPMGGIEFATIQERDDKMAFQCRYTILPSNVSRQFFTIMPSNAEQYIQYARFAEIMSKSWDKDMNAYLPKNGEGVPQVVEAPKTLDDEYASLTPEEIEAITGVKPEPKGASAAPVKTAKEQADDAQGIVDAASEEEIQRLMGMMMGGGQPEVDAAAEAPVEPAASSDSPMMSMEEIEALAKSVQQQGDVKAEVPAKTEAESADAMSAEDIWKQINGGKV